MRRVRVGLIVLVLALAAPAAARAAGTARAAGSATGGAMTTGTPSTVRVGPLATDAVMDAQLWPGQPGGAVVIVSATLPDPTKLPATVRLPLPEGAVVKWAGEVVGPTPDKDIERSFVTAQGTGGTYIEFTVHTSHIAQYEASYVAPSQQGDSFVSRFRWVQSAPVGTLRLAVKTNAGMTDVNIVPKQAQPPVFNEQGDSLYILGQTSPAVGWSSDITVTFKRTAGAASATPSTGHAGDYGAVLAIVGVLLFLAVAALVVVLVRQARGRAAG